MIEQPSNSIDLIKAYSDLEPEYLLICSYTLSLGYIEQKFLNNFKEKFNTKILVISSTSSIAQTFDESYSLRGAGTNYIVSSIEDHPYAFHPKIFLSIDKNGGISLFVTGCNFTYPGICLNLDAVDRVDLNEVDSRTTANIKSFLNGLENLMVLKEQKKILQAILARLPVPHSSPSPFTFLHNFEIPIGQQLIEYIGDKIEEIKVISPYYDERMFALDTLLKSTGQPKCCIVCNLKDKHVNLDALPKGVKVFVPNQEDKNRFLHAKAYIFKTTSKYFIAVGSANCTTPGLWNIPGSKGNWETVLVREVKQSEADDFFLSFSPTKVLDYSDWTFTRPDKDDVSKNISINFDASLQSGSIEISFNQEFKYTSISGKLTINYASSDVDELLFENLICNIARVFRVEFENKKKIQDQPCWVDLSITFPEKMSGRSWVIQKQVLSRTMASRGILNKIRNFQSDSIEGWSKFENIVQFIADNIGYVSSRSEKHSRKSRKKRSQSNIPTINGIVEVDELLPMSGYDGLSISDCFDLQRSLENLFERGFAIEEAEVDESDEQREENKHSSSIVSSKNLEQPVMAGQEILKKLPDFGEIFKHNIIEKFNTQISKCNEDTLSEMYQVMMNTVTFCFKLTRFLYVELPQKLTSEVWNSGRFFLETAPLLIALKRWLLRAETEFKIDETEISEMLEDSGLLQETGIILVEAWAKDFDTIIPLNDKVEMFNYLLKHSGKIKVNESITSLVSNSGRFDPGRHTLLIGQDLIEDAFNSISEYTDNFKKYSNIYRKCAKIGYWDQAYQHHERAYKYMIDTGSGEQLLIDSHKKKIMKARTFIDTFEKNIEYKFDRALVNKLKKPKKHFWVNEIKTKPTPTCPNCGNKLLARNYFTLMSFHHIFCKSCDCLLLPVEKHKSYESRGTSPYEWKNGL
ncbi:MAG: phospholipase D family protein [Fibrobacteria bacterium]|nr:phospholipase D family protein [Fibrobacteria bacterium]